MRCKIFPEKLIALVESVKVGLRDINIVLEDRAFNPHLTLGRVKNINDKENLKYLITEYKESEIQRITVREIIMYESILLPAGPLYKPLNKYKL